jgi:precorrin-6B methylase 2
MDVREAEALLSAAVPAGRGVWVDFGAGTGTFTHALANRLGAGSRVYAVDRDSKAIATLGRARAKWRDGVDVVPLLGDFAKAVALPGLEAGSVVRGGDEPLTQEPRSVRFPAW